MNSLTESSPNHFDLGRAVSDCRQELGAEPFQRLSYAVVAVAGLQEHLASRDRLQIVAHYLGPRFPRVGIQVVRTALLAGLELPSPNQIAGIAEDKPAKIVDAQIDEWIVDEVPILPVAVRLSDAAWQIDELRVVPSRSQFDNEIVKNLKFGPLSSR